MKFYKLIIAIILLISANSAMAFSDSEDESSCYAISMIGYDSVINSRLGVKPDELVYRFGYRTTAEIEFIRVALGAYSWKGTPHQYAIHIFFNCAQDTTK